MGFDQNDQPNSAAPSANHQFLNFLDIHKQEQPSPRVKEVFPDLDPAATRPGEHSNSDNSKTGIKSNFAGLPRPRTDNHIIDFTPPVYPAEKQAQLAKPDVLAQPINKYEKSVTEQVKGLDGEAKFSPYTADALKRDADKFPPKRNEKDGTTTYTIEQFGLTDRDLAKDQNTAGHYKRLVTITVPDQAESLKDCKFEYQDRQNIDQREFNALVDRAQKRQYDLSAATDAKQEAASLVNIPSTVKLPRPKDMAFYTHGIRTGAEGADFQALALQLTHGHSVINVDWKSTQASEEKIGVSEAYEINRKGAAQSYGKFEKTLDDTISHIGAEHTDMIAFSHGAMFDTKYLWHSKDAHAPRLNEVIFTHPDVPIAVMPQPDKDGKFDERNRLYTCVSKNTHVIGSTADLAMTGAAYNDCVPSTSESWAEQFQEKRRQMAIHARIGDGGNISRTLVAGSGGSYVMETIPVDKKDPYMHFINMNGISKLLNDPDRTTKLANLESTTQRSK
jgi:hypothetical protein